MLQVFESSLSGAWLTLNYPQLEQQHDDYCYFCHNIKLMISCLKLTFQAVSSFRFIWRNCCWKSSHSLFTSPERSSKSLEYISHLCHIYLKRYWERERESLHDQALSPYEIWSISILLSIFLATAKSFCLSFLKINTHFLIEKLEKFTKIKNRMIQKKISITYKIEKPYYSIQIQLTQYVSYHKSSAPTPPIATLV